MPLSEMQFGRFQEANASRNDKCYPDWRTRFSLLYWTTAVANEAGEVCGLAKKHHRDDRPLDNEKLGNELADVVTYCALLAESRGIDLGEACQRKFNIVSERLGFDPVMGKSGLLFNAQPNPNLK